MLASSSFFLVFVAVSSSFTDGEKLPKSEYVFKTQQHNPVQSRVLDLLGTHGMQQPLQNLTAALGGCPGTLGRISTSPMMVLDEALTQKFLPLTAGHSSSKVCEDVPQTLIRRLSFITSKPLYMITTIHI